MTRVKRADATRKRKNKVFKAAKGYRGGRSRLLRTAKEAVDKAGTSYSGWNIEKNSKESVTYSTLVTPLIKAVQELTEMVK